ncbi:hypothetical protein ACA910_021537 [Epithemia clementina (nom. ined.)]
MKTIVVVFLVLANHLGTYILVLGKPDRASPPPPPPPPPPPSLPFSRRGTTVEAAVDSAGTKNASKVETTTSQGQQPQRIAQTPASKTVSKSINKNIAKQKGNNNNDDDDDDDENSEDIPNDAAQDVQLTETEIWDGQKWRAPGLLSLSLSSAGGDRNHISNSDGRFTDMNEELCLPPSQQDPPPGSQWAGDWKILTSTSTRDAYGWEYSKARPYPMRQRIWLRSIQQQQQQQRRNPSLKKKNKSFLSSPKESRASKTNDKKLAKLSKKSKQTATVAATTSKTTTVGSSPSRRRKVMPRWMRAVADDFNFKGLGVVIWKGITAPKSIGVTVRIPLTSHFSSWDGNPALPKVNLMVGVYYPPMMGIFLSSSIRLAWVKWCIFQAYNTAQFLIFYLIWTFYRGLLLATSAMTFPLTRKLINPPFPVPSPWSSNPENESLSSWRSGPVFPRDVDERVGCSYSWRISASEGYHTTCRAFHCYSPTVVSLWKLADRVSQNMWPAAATIMAGRMPRWIARRSAELAFEVAGPLHSDPYFAGSTGLSLSGFYLGRRNSNTNSVKKQPLPQLQQARNAAGTRTTLDAASSTSSSSLLVDDDEDDDVNSGEFEEEEEEPSLLLSDSEYSDEEETLTTEKNDTLVTAALPLSKDASSRSNSKQPVSSSS